MFWNSSSTSCSGIFPSNLYSTSVVYFIFKSCANCSHYVYESNDVFIHKTLCYTSLDNCRCPIWFYSTKHLLQENDANVWFRIIIKMSQPVLIIRVFFIYFVQSPHLRIRKLYLIIKWNYRHVGRIRLEGPTCTSRIQRISLNS